ncbi:probable serine/threonine-protein kinase pats1 [Saccostrea cucullata]|uniref:probable serine/threonine-protein kinase pats1 n=1 Tax=Saccostrea cuccullata TaxID=36930 RepID=UPI002ED1B80E
MRSYKVNELKTFLRKEKTTVTHARGILVGCAEAGKTTLLKRLRGQSQNIGEVTESTRGLEVHQHVFIVKDGSLEVADDDSPLKTFIRINAADLKPNMSGAVDLSNPNENRDNSGLKSHYKERGETMLYSREEEKVELSSPPTKRKKEVSTVEIMASVLSSKEEKMVKDEIFQKILSEKENLPTVSMLDFAGQLAYYACHQIYVTPKAFFILVLDMTKKFEDVVDKEKDNQEGSIFSVWTYKDYLKFWITSIKTFGGTKAPLFIIVTHTEKTSTNEIEKYFEDFWNAVPDEDRVWLSESLNDRDYAVGLVELNDETKTKLESMKKSIVELFTDELNTKIEIPSSWALMEQLLYDGGWKVLSIAEIWRLNSSLPDECQFKSDEEMSKFLKCFHDNGILLYFQDEKLSEHAVLDIQWFAKAFSKIIADKNHINKDCKTRLIKDWKSFNKTGELKVKVVNALWRDEPLYLTHKSEIMSYMEKLQMLVPLESSGAVSEGDMSWYVPCMNKKQFLANFCEDKWECSSILCYHLTSFAMFVFYRLIAYCMGFLEWNVSTDEDHEGSLCLYQTAAVFDHKEHTVVVGICNDDIQLQVLRIRPLAIDREVSNEIGDSIQNAIKKLTETFISTNIFHKGFKCQNIICNEKDLSFTLESELSEIKAEETQCKCQLQRKHVINVQKTLGFWKKVITYE